MATFQTHLFRLSGNKIEMNFCKFVHYNGRKFSGATEQFYSTSQFFVFKNAKINFFDEQRDLSAVFIELKCWWLQTCLTDMKKKHKTLEMLLRADFLRIFKILHFLRFLKNISSTC